MTRPAIVITMGDPAGVGPEICLKAAADPGVAQACTPLIAGSAKVLSKAAELLGLTMPQHLLSPAELGEGFAPPGPAVIDIDNISLDDFVPGQVSAACGKAAAEYIMFAVERAMAGRFAAVTTAPISKKALNEAGIAFPGHTEMLEDLTRSGPPVMMLHGPRVTVSLVTTHIALRDVPAALDRGRIARVIRLTHDGMSRILGRAPRLAVLALNCHAGEGGMFGDEEERIIGPAIKTARGEGLDVDGPLSPDSAFCAAALGRYDAHVCMYHDQGLAPFKALSFEEGVNVTLGIPVIRTSVAHGTAFDIAWQGKADPSSMVAALALAARMAKG